MGAWIYRSTFLERNRDEVAGGWRNCMLRSFIACTLRQMIKSRMRWAKNVGQMETKGKAYRILMGKPEGKRPLGRPRRRWVDNIKIDLGVIGWGGMDWMDVDHDRDQWRALVNTVMNLRVP
jgi:hypothetical protein